MLKVRVIPTLLYKSVGLVKGVGFNSWRRVDTVLPAIKVYNMREVDELILVDIEATKEGRDPDYESIRDFSRECFVPFCVGGGICNIEQIRQLQCSVRQSGTDNGRRQIIRITVHCGKHRLQEDRRFLPLFFA